jgi:phosphoglycerol transferase
VSKSPPPTSQGSADDRAARRTNLLAYAGTALAALLLAGFFLQLWRADLNIPLAYEWRDLRRGGEELDPIGSNDALLFYSFFKGMRENGWYLRNPALGAPGEMDFNDYPFADSFHFLTIKVLEWLTPNFAVTVNLFFILGFPLTALTSAWVMRQFRLSWPLVFAGSLLYTFAPYHFLRGQQHIWLSAYYPVPLMILVVFWLLEGVPLFETRKSGWPGRPTRKGLVAILICILVSCTGVYYALFGIFFIFIASLLRCRTLKSLAPPVLIAAVIFAVLAANALPTVIHGLQHGKNPHVASHYGAEAEFFALRVMQMILPVMHHRVDAFAKFAAEYYNNAPFMTENATACLGLVGTAGFLLLLSWLIGLRWKTTRETTLTSLAAMNISAFLLATMGGFSSLLAFGVSPAIRCYNRFSIFIAFFAILTVLFLFEKWRERCRTDEGKKFGWGLALGGLLFLGLADQTTPFFVPPYAQSAVAWRSDREFVRQLEAKLPAGAMIFQLPYMPFPEGPPGEMSLLRPYLHSKSLRWSYGAMAGREADTWIKTTVMSDGNLPRIIQVLTEADFRGIYIDRQLLQDYRKVEDALKQSVDANPLVSENGRFSCFVLPPRSPAPK